MYVRETWAIAPGLLLLRPGPVFKADYTENELAELKKKHFRWHPSIHMPKEYARIFLRVTNIRAERLQNITEEGAISEGVYQIPDRYIDAGRYTYTAVPQPGYCWTTARECFAWGIWNSTIKPTERALFGWDANPWIRVIEFERISKEEALVEDMNTSFQEM